MSELRQHGWVAQCTRGHSRVVVCRLDYQGPLSRRRAVRAESVQHAEERELALEKERVEEVERMEEKKRVE